MSVLLVTGGSRGIGAQICRMGAAQGWSVAVNYAESADQAEDVVGVTDAFVHLVYGLEWESDRSAGIGAFSYAAGPAVLAAAEPRIRGRVDFVLAIGGYYDLEQVLTFITTGYFREGDEWRQLRPIRYGKWVFVRSNLERIQDPADRQTLEEIVERRMKYSSAPVAELAARLGEEGRAVYALVTN